MEESLKKVIELEGKLKQLLPYIKNKKISKVVKWAEEDLGEMQNIRKELLEKNLLDKADSLKEKVNYNIDKKENVETNILKVYKVIEEELESWRRIYLYLIKMTSYKKSIENWKNF